MKVKIFSAIALTLLIATPGGFALAIPKHCSNVSADPSFSPVVRKRNVKRSRCKTWSCLARRTRVRSLRRGVYWVAKDLPFVRATFGTMGIDRSFAVGPRGGEEIALGIWQGLEGTEGDSAFEIDASLDAHWWMANEIYCIGRVWCKRNYSGAMKKLCRRDLTLVHSKRRYYGGPTEDLPYGENVKVVL